MYSQSIYRYRTVFVGIYQSCFLICDMFNLEEPIRNNRDNRQKYFYNFCQRTRFI